MKRILFSCLLGLGLLLITVVAKSNAFGKIITVAIEGNILSLCSDPASGQLQMLDVYDEMGNLVEVNQISGYKASVVLSLPSGSYEATVYSGHDRKTFPINI